MALEIVGMIGVKPDGAPGASVHVIGGGIDTDYLVDFARAHEEAGFDRVLVGYTSGSADGFLVTSYASSKTESLKFLLAHRPGFVMPTLAARKAATLDNFTGGRLALHIITGGHANKTARTVAIRQDEPINTRALLAIFRQIVANNRAGGWRLLNTRG